MDFKEALEYLTDLTKFGVNLGLARIEELLKRLNQPHCFLKIIHVGGTNGKGSTTAMLAAILQAAGYRVGTFTSPHLHSYCERFQINGEKIAENRLADLLTELKPHLTAMVEEGFEQPTEFEVSTALAMQYFHQEKVDFLILEVGMGGAIDSTNVVTPLISVITNVSIDHTDYLGQTNKEIARVKAGIIKPGIPVVTAAAGEALTIIAETCRYQGAPLLVAGRDFTWRQHFFSLAGQCFSVWGRRGLYKNLWLPLLGRHQQTNAVLAIAAVELLVEQGFITEPRQVHDGLAATYWPARLEVLPGEPLVLLDGAHNYDGAKQLRRALLDYLPDRKMVLVAAMLADKERVKVMAELAPAASTVIVTKLNNPRAGDWRELAVEARRHVPLVYLIEKIQDALAKALSLACSDSFVCVTGSLYLVAEARALLLR